MESSDNSVFSSLLLPPSELFIKLAASVTGFFNLKLRSKQIFLGSDLAFDLLQDLDKSVPAENDSKHS